MNAAAPTNPAGFVVVEYMPEVWAESHRAAGNFGTYPYNGAKRVLMVESDAIERVSEDPDGYARIVGAATLSDLTRYEREGL